MAERKAVNKYHPPDWDPRKGGLNKYHGQHHLRDRARKLHLGILIIRFEMPFNIWCLGCNNHLAMGNRYNAEKKTIGEYFSTPIYSFRFKCHLCSHWIEIHSDPQHATYNVVSGGKRKTETWEASSSESFEFKDAEEAEKLATNAFYRLEHEVEDKGKADKVVPIIQKLQKRSSNVWKDDFSSSQLLRKKFREEKKIEKIQEQEREAIREKVGIKNLKVLDITKEDEEKAKAVVFDKARVTSKSKRMDIAFSSIFPSNENKNDSGVVRMLKRASSSRNRSLYDFTKNPGILGIEKTTTKDSLIKEKKGEQLSLCAYDDDTSD